MRRLFSPRRWACWLFTKVHGPRVPMKAGKVRRFACRVLFRLSA